MISLFLFYSQPQRVCNDCHVVLTSRRQGVAKSSVYSLLTESQASVALPSSARPSLDGFAPEKSFYRPPSDTLLPAVSEKSASTISLHGSQQHMNSNFAASRESVASVTAGGRIILDAHDAVDAVEVGVKNFLVVRHKNTQAQSARMKE